MFKTCYTRLYKEFCQYLLTGKFFGVIVWSHCFMNIKERSYIETSTELVRVLLKNEPILIGDRNTRNTFLDI